MGRLQRSTVVRRGALLGRLLGLALCLTAAGSCNSLVREGRASSFLVIGALEGASGADPDIFGGVLASDVLTLVPTQIEGVEVRVPTVFEDLGRVTMRLGFKDPGTPTAPSAPTSANWITVTRYRVVFTRADGRNTPGVDVPFGFDGATTFTVVGETTAGFTLVRAQAKQEAPLAALAVNGGAQIISTIAEVTFFGHDQTGAEVIGTGKIGVNFANWGDPE